MGIKKNSLRGTIIMGRISKQIDFFLIQQNYRNWAISIANNKIANPRQHAQHRIIIAKIQLKLKHNYRKKQNGRLTYNLTNARQSGEILSNIDLNNLENWDIDTPKDNIEQNWINLKNGILKTLESKFPKSKRENTMINYWLTYETKEPN